MSLALIIGLGIATFILLYLSFNIEEKHFVLRLLGVMFAIILLLLLSKGSIDSNTVCEQVINTSTTIGAVTNYTYMPSCYTTTNNTAKVFYKLMMSFLILFLGYLIFYLGYWGLISFQEWIKSKKT